MPRWRSFHRTTSAFVTGLLVVALAGLVVLGGPAASARPAAQPTRSAARLVTTVKGSPQPELIPFVIGKSSGPAFVSTDGADGDYVIAYEVATANADGAIVVCVLDPGARACASRTTLHTEKDSSVYDHPFVTVEGSEVFVAMDECCHANDLLFESTDGGATFGTPYGLGTADGPNIDAVEAFGVHGQVVHIMWAEDNAGGTFPVEFAPLSDPAGGAQVVTAMTDGADADFFTAGLGSYAGRVIAAGSDSNDATIASVAQPASTTFQQVGRFTNQDLITVSGSALVTQETTGGQSLVLRLFDGTDFGPPHVVPLSGGGGPNWNWADQISGGRTYIFTERNQDAYDLEMQSTTDGVTWTPHVDLGNAIDSSTFAAAIGSGGNGVVVGTSGPTTVFPVLNPQSVSFTLSKSEVGPGVAVTASGKGTSPEAGRWVQLQELRGGLWYVVATTHESASGAFSFTVPGQAAGSYTYRAATDLLPGYLQYGYSSGRVLTVRS